LGYGKSRAGPHWGTRLPGEAAPGGVGKGKGGEELQTKRNTKEKKRSMTIVNHRKRGGLERPEKKRDGGAVVKTMTQKISRHAERRQGIKEAEKRSLGSLKGGQPANNERKAIFRTKGNPPEP